MGGERFMNENIEHGMSGQQIQDVMERFAKLEKSLRDELANANAQIIALKTEVKNLNQKINELTLENIVLRTENQRLTTENRRLTDENERMKRTLNNNSTNSSQPPSSDQKGKSANTYNTREKTGKKRGGQKGHKGTTLTRKTVEEKIENGEFQYKREDRGNPGGDYVSRYVIDLQVIPTATELRFFADETGKITLPEEYRSEVVYGPFVKAMAVALYADGVMSNDRIRDFINAISGGALGLSTGSVYGFCSSFAAKCAGSLRRIKDEILGASVVGTDATTMTTNGVQTYIRNFSIEDAVIYISLMSKNLKAMEGIELLTKITSILMHDHETALYHFGGDHAECMEHLIRYLIKNTQESKNLWSDDLVKLLVSMNTERNRLKEIGEKSMPDETIADFEAFYDELITRGRAQNAATKGAHAKNEEKTLLNRLVKFKRNHLLFLHNFHVPFTNNQSERDLRKGKNRQKMAGGFREPSGSQMYCDILSVIETCKRKKMAIFANLVNIFNGVPAIF